MPGAPRAQPTAPEAPPRAVPAPSLDGRKRILVIGSGGAGKSTFARALAAQTGLPLIHLDRHHWRRGWQPTPTEEWNAVVTELAAQDEWIMDGNFGSSLGIRLRRCDAVVFFDFPRVQCLWGVLKRRVTVGARTRPDMGDGCPERLDLEFLRWIWSFPRSTRPRIATALGAVSSDIQVVTVASRRDVRELLAACGPPAHGIGVAMNRLWTIIGVADVARSFRWYQTLLGQSLTSPAHDYFGQILDDDGTVLLCLHRWGDHEHPPLAGPQNPGNGLLLFFRVDAFDDALQRARMLVAQLAEEPHVSPSTGTREFALRDPDGYYVMISALA